MMIRDGHTMDVVVAAVVRTVAVEADVIHGRDLKIRWIGLSTFRACGRACVIVLKWTIVEFSRRFSRLIPGNPCSSSTERLLIVLSFLHHEIKKPLNHHTFG